MERWTEIPPLRRMLDQKFVHASASPDVGSEVRPRLATVVVELCYRCMFIAVRTRFYFPRNVLGSISERKLVSP